MTPNQPTDAELAQLQSLITDKVFTNTQNTVEAIRADADAKTEKHPAHVPSKAASNLYHYQNIAAIFGNNTDKLINALEILILTDEDDVTQRQVAEHLLIHLINDHQYHSAKVKSTPEQAARAVDILVAAKEPQLNTIVGTWARKENQGKAAQMPVLEQLVEFTDSLTHMFEWITLPTIRKATFATRKLAQELLRIALNARQQIKTLCETIELTEPEQLKFYYFLATIGDVTAYNKLTSENDEGRPYGLPEGQQILIAWLALLPGDLKQQPAGRFLLSLVSKTGDYQQLAFWCCSNQIKWSQGTYDLASNDIASKETPNKRSFETLDEARKAFGSNKALADIPFEFFILADGRYNCGFDALQERVETQARAPTSLSGRLFSWLGSSSSLDDARETDRLTTGANSGPDYTRMNDSGDEEDQDNTTAAHSNAPSSHYRPAPGGGKQKDS